MYFRSRIRTAGPWVIAVVALLVAAFSLTRSGSGPTGSNGSVALAAGGSAAKPVPNADKVDGLHASKTPRANQLLALNRQKKLPSSVVPAVIGPAGQPGPKGDTGTPGAVGPQGLKGDSGGAGPQGPKGDAGAMGAQGPKGDSGATGAAGADGKSVLHGTVAPAVNVGTIGDFYLDTLTSGLYGPKTSAGWGTTPTSLIGPKGDTGAAGPQGAKGDTGATGPPGPSTGPAGGALAGTFPNPTLNVSGGDSGASGCNAGEALTSLSPQAVLTCQPFGDITAVQAGGGLQGGGATGSVTLSLAPSYTLPQGCTPGQLATPAGGPGSIWGCVSGASPTGAAGGDLTGTYPNPTIAAGRVTTSDFASGATAPNATNLAGAPATAYGAVMSGRVNDLMTTLGSYYDYGAPSGTSTADATESNVYTLSPNHNLQARDLSVKLTAAPGPGISRYFWLQVNGVQTTGCSIYGTATSCTATGPWSVPAGSTLSITDYPYNGSPAAADALFAFRLTEQ